jgi:hypothetical protein
MVHVGLELWLLLSLFFGLDVWYGGLKSFLLWMGVNGKPISGG